MRIVHPVNTLAVSRNQWLTLLKNLFFLNLVKSTFKNSQRSKDSESVFISFVASVVVDFFCPNSDFSLNKKIQKYFGTYAATWWQKLAVD